MSTRAVGTPHVAAAAAVRAIMSRCVPWLNLRIGATLDRNDGAVGEWIASESAICVATKDGFCDAIDTVHHEIWHALDLGGWLSSSAVAAVDEMAAGGIEVPTDYMRSPHERRARLYAAFARALDEGLCVRIMPDDLAVRVMFSVYTGELGREVVSQISAKSRPPKSRLRRLWDFVVH